MTASSCTDAAFFEKTLELLASSSSPRPLSLSLSLHQLFSVARILPRVPASRSSARFSATMSTAIKSVKAIAPLLDRILVQRIKSEAKTASGIILPESTVKDLNEAKVLAVGPGALDKDGKRITPSVQPGDKVLIPQYGGTPIKVNDDDFSLYRESEILAKINE